MRFAVLGPLAVRADDGTEVPVGGLLPRSLLAALLVAEGRPVPADTLVEALWDGAPPASATSTLHSTVSRLRRVLDPAGTGRLRLELGGYVLDTSGAEVDSRTFLRLADEGRELLAGDPAAALARLCEAERLWRGPAYAEVAARGHVRPAAVRLDERRLDAQEDRVEAELRLGAGAGLLGDLAALTEAQPLRERLRGQHALALYRAGRQADALAVLASTRALLREELGLDLSPALQDLEARLLRQDPALLPPPSARAPAAPVASVPAQRTGSPTVGRDGELALLRALVGETAAGAVRFAVLEGEPGIGKTRMLEELAHLAAQAGVRVVWGRCADSDVVPAYWPWLEALRVLTADRADGGGDLPGELVELLQPGTAPEQPATDDRRFRLFEACTSVLADAARRTPLLVLLDDVHWADPASAELLQHLVLRLRDVPVGLVVAMRELDLGSRHAVGAAVAAMTRRDGTRRLLLRPVPASVGVALVRSAVDEPVSVEAAATIHRRAEGNPFFIAELSRLLRDHRLLDDPASASRVDVPAGVRDVVGRRLAALPAQTRQVLELAAVLGREADLGVLAAASGTCLDDCIDAVEPALRSRVLVPAAEVPGRVRFAHALVRDAALAEVSALRRTRLHQRVAEALLDTVGHDDDSTAAIATHMWEAAPLVGPLRAAAALERAATVALRRTAYESADDLLSRALELRRSSGGDRAAQELELLLTVRLVGLRRARLGYSRAYSSVPLERAEQLAVACGRTDVHLGLLIIRWGAAGTSGDIPETERLSRVISETAAGSDDPVVHLIGASTWAITCWHLGRLREADASMVQVLAGVPHLSEADLSRLSALDSAALFLSFAEHVRVLAGAVEADGRFERLLERFTSPYDQMVVANFAGMTAVLSGDTDAAERWGRRAAVLDRDESFSFFGGACQQNLGWALARQGRPEEGLALLEHGAARFREAGARTGWGFLAGMHVEVLLLAGRPVAQARAVLEAAAAEVAEQGERFVLPYLDLARARVALAAGAPVEEVERHLDTAVRTAEEMGIAPVAGLADALRRTATTD